MTGAARGYATTLAATAVLLGTLAGCASGGAASPAAPRGSARGTAPGAVATRWWSNGAAKVGSAIDAGDPGSLAGRLHRSSAQYCTMLRQTVAAQHSILPGAGAQDPALATSTRAFVAELQAVAPAAVAAQWRTLGRALESLVDSGGDLARVPAGTATQQAQVARAAQTVAADARTSCGVNLAG